MLPSLSDCDYVTTSKRISIWRTGRTGRTGPPRLAGGACRDDQNAQRDVLNFLTAPLGESPQTQPNENAEHRDVIQNEV